MSKDQTVRYSDKELEEFREIVESKLEKARKELNYLRDQIIDLNENLGDDQGIDYIDDSSSFSELENLNYMVNRQEQFIGKLENALLRIKNKSYGICIVTGELIDKERLKRVPHATKSLQAKVAPPEKSKVVVPERPKATKPTKPKIHSRIIKKSSPNPKQNEDSADYDDTEWDEDLSLEENGDDDYLNIDPDDLSDDDISFDDKD